MVVVLWHDVGGGVVVVLWHDVGRLCRFLFGRCYRELCSGALRSRCLAKLQRFLLLAAFAVRSG